jgi:hypothetical protein
MYIYIMSLDINIKLAQFLREGQNWEKEPTNIQGVSLLKLPASKQMLLYIQKKGNNN